MLRFAQHDKNDFFNALLRIAPYALLFIPPFVLLPVGDAKVDLLAR